MLARVLSAALSRQSAARRDADVNGIEAFPVEAEVTCGWGDMMAVIIMSISPSERHRLSPDGKPASFNQFKKRELKLFLFFKALFAVIRRYRFSTGRVLARGAGGS
jgi:hypothetical protein